MELKAYKFLGIDEIYPDANLGSDYYLKSEADKVIAHHKYERCLAMARMCSSYKFAWSFIPEDNEVHKSDFYKKWSERWLELAEKFKPNKE